MAKKKGRRRGGSSAKTAPASDRGFDLGDEDRDVAAKFDDIGDDDDDLYEDDIDQFHKGRDKILLEKAGGNLYDDDDDSPSGGEDEVLKFDDDDDSDDDSDDEMNETIKIQMNRLKRQRKGLDEEEEEEEEEEAGDRNEKAGKWGTTKSSAYYGADHAESDEDDEEEAEESRRLELEEAKIIQKRIESKYDDDDFGIDLFPSTTRDDDDDDDASRRRRREEAVAPDVSRLSKGERLELLKKESPEFLGLVKDYAATLVQLRDRFQPLHDLVEGGRIPPGVGADYVRLKHGVLMSYCVNMSFYLMLKAKRTPVANHPVIKRLLRLKKTMKELEPLDERLEPEAEAILKMVAEGVELRPTVPKAFAAADENGDVEDDEDGEDEDDSGAETDEPPEEVASGGRGGVKRKRAKVNIEIEEKLKKMKKLGGADLWEEGDAAVDAAGDAAANAAAVSAAADETEKRKATEQMEKNRGLTPHKRKDLKNPRVRLREKYRKAKIRRKGAVREHRYQMDKYGGELSGIRAGLKKGIKLLS